MWFWPKFGPLCWHMWATLTNTNKPPDLPASFHPTVSVTKFMMLFAYVTMAENMKNGLKHFRKKVVLQITTTTTIQLSSKQRFLLTFPLFLVWVPALRLQPKEQQKQYLMLLERPLSLSAWKSPSLPNYHQMVSCNSQCACTSFESRLNPEAWPWDFFTT